MEVEAVAVQPDTLLDLAVVVGQRHQHPMDHTPVLRAVLALQRLLELAVAAPVLLVTVALEVDKVQMEVLEAQVLTAAVDLEELADIM